MDILFLPSFIRLPASGDQDKNAQACPYAQALPYIARSSVRFGDIKAIEPILYLQDERHFSKSMQMLGASLGKGRAAVKRAQRLALQAQEKFLHAVEERGRAVLSAIKPGEKALVLIGRSYNTCDPGLNMNLPSKITGPGHTGHPHGLSPAPQRGQRRL